MKAVETWQYHHLPLTGRQDDLARLPLALLPQPATIRLMNLALAGALARRRRLAV